MIYNKLIKYIANVKQVRNLSYTKEKMNFDKIVSFWLYYVTRPISFLLTPLFYLLKVSATKITIIGFLVGLISLSAGFTGSFIISSILYNIFLIFDCIDGNIARLNIPSKKGEYIDAITGDIINFFYIPFIGLGIYRNEIPIFFKNLLTVENLFSIALVSSLFHLLSVLVSQRKKIIFDIKTDRATRISKNNKVQFTEYLFRNSFGVAFNAPFSIFFAYFEILDFFIIYNLLIMFIVLIFSLIRK